MKLVTAIVLVLSQVSLRSCRTRHSISLLQDGHSSELTLVAPHKVPTIAQLIPILEGLDPPETKVSKLKKLIPIYDELNRWRLNNKKRLVEIIPLKKNVKPLAFILPGNSPYVDKLKKPTGSDEDSDEATVESTDSGEAIHKNTKHQAHIERHTHKPEENTSTNKHKSHSSHSSHKSHSHTYKTDTSATHTASEENKSKNSATKNILSLRNVEELPEDVSDSDYNESSSGSKEFESNESESASNVSNESDSNVHKLESSESNPRSKPDLVISATESGYSSSRSSEDDSNSKPSEAIIASEDSEPRETDLESDINSDSSKSAIETNTESSESSVTTDSNDVSRKIYYDSDSNSEHESIQAHSESVVPDAVLSSESYSESDSNSELNGSSSESTESEISNSESSQSNSSSDSREVATNMMTKDHKNHIDSNEAEKLAVGIRRSYRHHENDDEDESIDTTVTDNQLTENYDYQFNANDDNTSHQPAYTKHMLDRFHGNYNDVKELGIENTNSVKQHHENGKESNGITDEFNEVDEPIVAIKHVSHHKIDASNNGDNDDEAKDSDDSKNTAEPIDPRHITKKHHGTTAHINNQHHKNDNQEIDEESTTPIAKKHHEHHHHGYDDNIADDTLVTSKHIANHKIYDFDEIDESGDGTKSIDNKHDEDYDKYESVVPSNENYVLSDETDDALVATTRMDNIHLENYDSKSSNDDESKVDEFTDYSSDGDQTNDDNEVYDDNESYKVVKATEMNDLVAAMQIIDRYPRIDHGKELVASITHTTKTHHKVDNNEPKTGNESNDREYNELNDNNETNANESNDYGSIDDEFIESDESVADTQQIEKKHHENRDIELKKDDKADESDVSNYVDESKTAEINYSNEPKNEFDNDSNDKTSTDNEFGNKDILKRDKLIAATKHITKNHVVSETKDKHVAKYDESKDTYPYEETSDDKGPNHVEKLYEVKKPVFSRHMMTEHDMKLENLSDNSELCKILRRALPTLKKSDARQEKKKYILSFIFNR